jgi:regulator of sigma E protease
MSWLLAFLGFAALVILHELGHFVAAKAVGMRVERFALFFPPLLLRHKHGETEYALGAIPLGGYVKITGMSPAEEVAPEHKHRSYHRQPVWKRVVVIAAGPAVNVVLAFVLLVAVFMANGTSEPPARVAALEQGSPAAKVLRTGDAIVAIDGRRPAGDTLDAQTKWIIKAIGAHEGTPLSMTVRRGGGERTLEVTPFFDKGLHPPRWRVGFVQEGTDYPAGPLRACGLAVSTMWNVTSRTVSTLARIFEPAQRKQVSGVVGSYEVTRQSFSVSTSYALTLLALISLSLGVINLFPFLPLDGGHIFWALVEKLRGRAVSLRTIERASFVGFALVICLFAIGLSNDIGHLANGGIRAR